MADKQERWHVSKVPITGGVSIRNESNELIAAGLLEEDADPIVALHNAALDIGDPMAVAENMGGTLKLFKDILQDYIHCAPDENGKLTPARKRRIKNAKSILTAITKPTKGDNNGQKR